MRTPIRSLSSLLALAACGGPESGIDRTVLRGVVEIGPSFAAEAASDTNGPPESAEDLGLLGYRVMRAEGTIAAVDAAATPDVDESDVDAWSFVPLRSGPITLDLFYGDVTADSGEPEQRRFGVQVWVFDDATSSSTPTLLLEGDSTGAYGWWSVPLEVEADRRYAVVITPVQAFAADLYQLRMSGFNPSDAGVLVGAYAADDPAARGLPLGGTDVPTFEFFSGTDTWRGAYEMRVIQAVTTVEKPAAGKDIGADTGTPGDTGAPLDSGTGGGGGDGAAPETTTETTIDADVASVLLFAGTFASLDAPLSTGTLYNATALRVNTRSEDVEAPLLVVDTMVPLLSGFVASETEPNNIVFAPDDSVDPASLSGASPLGSLSGIGIRDLVRGDILFGDGDTIPNDDDLFSFTVDEPMAVSVQVSWDDPSADLDYYILGPLDGLPAEFLALADDQYANPEVGTTDFVLEPGQTFYLWVNGYDGPAGVTAPYKVSLEGVAP